MGPCLLPASSSKGELRRYRAVSASTNNTQPQLLTILYLMCHEDWTFREAGVHLDEHRELRQTLGLVSVPTR